MKGFALFVLLVGSLFAAESEKIFKVEDKAGNLIFETSDSLLVKQFTNVRIRSFENPVKPITLDGDTVTDGLKFILEKKLGTPKSGVYYYSISWQTPNGGSITLNKHPTAKSVLIASFKARQWLRDNVDFLKDDLKEDAAAADSSAQKKARLEKTIEKIGAEKEGKK
jgi:hypothetical protein